VIGNGCLEISFRFRHDDPEVHVVLADVAGTGLEVDVELRLHTDRLWIAEQERRFVASDDHVIDVGDGAIERGDFARE